MRSRSPEGSARWLISSIPLIFVLISCGERTTGLSAPFSGGQHPIQKSALSPSGTALSAQSCKGCHGAIYQQWQGSQHGRSYTNPLYRHGFAEEPLAQCMNCHAPLWENKKAEFDKAYFYKSFDLPIVNEGVNCAVCHLRNDRIISGNLDAEKLNGCLLPLKYDAELRQTKFCANCHQFNFPAQSAPQVVHSSVPMQETVSEFKQTGWHTEGKSCQHCHFKRGNHNANSAHSSQDLKAALRFSGKYVESKDKTGSYLHAKIGFSSIGHHFPTGDLFHVLTLFVYDEDENAIAHHNFDKHVRVIDRKLLYDSRIHIKAGEKGSAADVWLTVPTRPVLCRVVLRLQGRIESRIQKHLTKEQLQSVAYQGPCEADQWAK